MYSPVEVAGREADAEFDDLDDLPEVLPGRGVVDARRQRGLAQAEILEGIHDHVGQLVAGVAVPLLPADHQIDERLVSHEIHGGFLAAQPHTSAHLDEPAAQQLGRLGLGDHAVADVVPIERIQVLVGPSEGDPRLVFLQREQRFREPHGLQRLLKRRERIVPSQVRIMAS